MSQETESDLPVSIIRVSRGGGMGWKLCAVGTGHWQKQFREVCVDDHSPPGSSVHGILQARILEWVAISCSRVSSQPRDQNHVF